MPEMNQHQNVASQMKPYESPELVYAGRISMSGLLLRNVGLMSRAVVHASKNEKILFSCDKCCKTFG